MMGGMRWWRSVCQRLGVSYVRDVHPYLGEARQWRLRWRRVGVRVALFIGPPGE